MDDYDLSKFEDFSKAVAGTHPRVHRGTAAAKDRVQAHGYYCVECGGKRRMIIGRLHWLSPGVSVRLEGDLSELFVGPALFSMVCLQCGTQHTALVHLGPDGYELAIFSAERGGFSTPSTPSNVSYYLDQAHRAESVGATSAAAGMYRSALEMLLYEQGYKNGMLGQKIKDLLAD